MRARYNGQATTTSLADVMLAESSNQAQNRSIPSSSKAKGKAPGETNTPPPVLSTRTIYLFLAVRNAQKVIKKTVAKLRIRNENSNAAVAEGVRA